MLAIIFGVQIVSNQVKSKAQGKPVVFEGIGNEKPVRYLLLLSTLMAN